jgi:phospholipid transport system substrate-binding protein
MTRRRVLQAILAAACLMPLPAAAADTAAAPDAVTGPVAELNAALLALMKAGHAVPFATRYVQLAPVIDRVFDLPAILKASVGLRWATLAQDDQARLLDAFRSYTVSSYVANFDGYGGQRFVILPNRQSVGEKMVVATQIVPVSRTPARIDYVLHPDQGGGPWKIVDIMLDGSISQVAVQRSEFYGLLGDGGVAKLIATLQRKTADLSAGAATSPAGNVATGTPR